MLVLWFGRGCCGLAVGVGVWPLVLGFSRFFSLRWGVVWSSALLPMNMVFAVFLEKTTAFFLLGRGRGVWAS